MKNLRRQHSIVFKRPVMIIHSSVTVTLTRKITSRTIPNFIPHWKNGLTAQHSLTLNPYCRPDLAFLPDLLYPFNALPPPRTTLRPADQGNGLHPLKLLSYLGSTVLKHFVNPLSSPERP